jgi:hypothetical protein
MDGWIEITSCINCNASVVPYASVATAPYLMVTFSGGSLPVLTSTTYVKCEACGLVAQSPRMTDERIDQFYSSGLYRQTLGIPVESMDADELARARDISLWLRAHNISPQSHIDIGASRGYLLREVGAPVQYGLDSNKDYGGSTSGNVGKYELVTAIHVLEHVTNPHAEIQLYKSLSTDKVLIEVPGMNCKGGPLRFAHLYYYPSALLVEMLEQAGMTILELETEPNTRVLAKV